jgi:hypothetical protein
MGRDVTRADLLAAVEKVTPANQGARGQRRARAPPDGSGRGGAPGLRALSHTRPSAPRRPAGGSPHLLPRRGSAFPGRRLGGWCMFNSGALPISTAFLHDDAADEIFAKDPHTIMSGTIFPPGRAVPSPGGYTVSGRWVYASGCWHATWHMAVCNVCEAGANECRLGPTGLPETIVVHFPRAQMIILL